MDFKIRTKKVNQNFIVVNDFDIFDDTSVKIFV